VRGKSGDEPGAQKLPARDAVESVQMTFGVAVFSPPSVVARVTWMFVHVVVTR
jgi:hypothetical protein